MNKEYLDSPEITAFKVFVNNKNLNNENELIQVIERGVKLNISPNVMVSVTKKAKPYVLSIINNLKQKNDENNYNNIFNNGREKGYLEGLAAGEKKVVDYYKKVMDDNDKLFKKVESLKGVITEKNNELAVSELKRKKDKKNFYFMILPATAFVCFCLGFLLQTV